MRERFRRRLVQVAAAFIVGFGSLAIPQLAHAQTYRFDLPAQPLSDALRAVGRLVGKNVMFDPSLVEGRTAPALRADVSLEEAIGRLLAGTELGFQRVESDTILLTPETEKGGKPAAQARPSEGNLRLAQADAGEAGQPSGSDAQGELDELVVTGSRLGRSGDGPSPVTVFDRQRIDRLGVTNVADVLNFVPQQPFSSNEFNNFGGSRVVRLRGLGMGTTLVLIDGRRTGTSALLGTRNGFDLNAIPLAAVERVEVLSDSASAVYGADAVGGVVNIILKREIERPVIDLYIGGARGGAEERRASASFGHSSGRWRSAAILDFYERDALLGKERDVYANQDFTRFGSLDFRSASGNPGNVRSTTGANLPGLPSSFAAIPIGSTGVGLTPADFVPTAGETHLYSLTSFLSIIPESRRAAVMASSELDLTDRVSAFGKLFYTERDETRRLFPARMSNRLVPATNPFNPFGEDVLVSYLFEGLGPQRQKSPSDVWGAVLGFKGPLGTWDWEVTGHKTRDKGSDATYNTVDSASLDAALAATDPANALNVFQDGPGGSPALLASLVAPATIDRFSADLEQLSAFTRGAILQLPAGALEAVIGAEARREALSLAATSANLFLDRDRDSRSAFAELKVPLVSAAMSVPLISRMVVSIAGRYDRYSDFGSTRNPQLGLEWAPTPSLLLRGSFGESFIAPSLYQLYRGRSEFSGIPIPDPRRNGAEEPGTIILGGNPDLRPETADSLTAGFVWTPSGLRGVRIAASYWSIKQDQRIQQPFFLSVIANESLFPTRVLRAAPSADDIAAGQPGPILSVDSSNLNAGKLDTHGIDAEFSWAVETARGRFDWQLAATRVDQYSAATFETSPVVERVGVADLDGSIPRWRGTMSLGWSVARASVVGTARYVSSYDDVNIFGERGIRTVNPPILVDLQASLDLSTFADRRPWRRGLSVRVGVQNVFDEEAPFSDIDTSGIDPSQADVRQRFVYLGISKEF